MPDEFPAVDTHGEELREGETFYAEKLTYYERLPELMEHEGSYVVIKGEEIVAIEPNVVSAFSAGLIRTGSDGSEFLCRRIQAEPHEHSIPSLWLVRD